ncbi:hypothetical protein HD554DRAFT_1670465 [Boletus coccyginus]|nr:hypothetical protein HD554DRAFT_1670465 [Boletus coccyginus]
MWSYCSPLQSDMFPFRNAELGQTNAQDIRMRTSSARDTAADPPSFTIHFRDVASSAGTPANADPLMPVNCCQARKMAPRSSHGSQCCWIDRGIASTALLLRFGEGNTKKHVCPPSALLRRVHVCGTMWEIAMSYTRYMYRVKFDRFGRANHRYRTALLGSFVMNTPYYGFESESTRTRIRQGGMVVGSRYSCQLLQCSCRMGYLSTLVWNKNPCCLNVSGRRVIDVALYSFQGRISDLIQPLP